MAHFIPAPAATVSPLTVETMQDAKDYLTIHGPIYLLQAIRTLETHTNYEPLSTMDATEKWVDDNFPKARKGIHPRPDLSQKIGAYRKWRSDLLRAVGIATGARKARKIRDALQDGWAEILAAVELHKKDGGLVPPASASSVASFADIARRAGLEPWELDGADTIERLEAVRTLKSDREVLKKGLTFLSTYGFIPEIAVLLPETPLPKMPALRARAALPENIDAALVAMVDVTASVRDEVAGKDSSSIQQSTRDRYLAAIRHHVRTLPQCPAEPDLGYHQPITELEGINDPDTLFTLEHLKASIRRTEALEHLPGTLSQASAYCYYNDILVVLNRNGLIDDEFFRQIKTSKFLNEGRELAKGMRQGTRDWCERLITNAESERRFTNLHRILQGKADKILDIARDEGRDPYDENLDDLTLAELSRVRALGTAAAASAIEYAGRPIRRANVLGMRLRGSKANFLLPSSDRPTYRFFLTAAETKSGKDEPPANLRKELYGPQVIAWYLKKIRPLFPHAADNIHLFPSVEIAGKALGKSTFDAWFQRAASEANIPMTFHRWRHGYATLLLAEDWNNLQLAADMLGNTLSVCAASYAWINKPEIISAGQDQMINRSKGRK